MSARKRRQLFIDGKVQGALVVRVMMYWFYCLLSVALMTACWAIFSDRPATSADLMRRVWIQCGPALFASVLLLPIVIVDCVRLSNKFAGPVKRLRHAMKDLADGRHVRPQNFRDGDFWFDFAEDFNRVLARIQAAESAHCDNATDHATTEEEELVAT